ncbi:mediator of RNA polymerase II transcription subunit 1 [Anabrus simplex]|uniref:mediator of RNA polymerase II transcription subunit 1 n=1 Tax=Anabrus simplex TaxID=316456 RepID=UPI0035A360F0
MSSVYGVKGYPDGAPNQKNSGPGQNVDKTKEWQMELLMEKLRSKAGQFKSFVESAKALRMSLLEKRYPVDNVERSQLQKCLDTLQHSIKVTSLQGMVERLESVSRQLGLKFVAGPTGLDWFISSDMFYLEVVLEASGGVKDVKIHHDGKVEQQSCEELVACLSRGDFADFTAQLEGLASIYQLNAEKKVKCKAFSALQSLETDLGTLAQLQTFIKEPFNLVHKSPVGILEKRRGGHAMKLTYLVPPYELLDQKSKTLLPLSVEEVTSKNLGYSVMVCMEGSTAHKLQTAPIMTVNRSPNGKSSPSYAALTASNSATLPACFVLRLNHPLPMCLALVRRIQQVTEIECGDLSSPHPLLSLITQHASAGQLDCANNRGLFVSLPDQQHCYFMTESKNLEGILVTNIPFSHPAHVPQILLFLRQQALFNVLVASCIRPASKQDLENMIMFEVTALSWQHLSVSFEHPLEETMTTAELDLTDIANVKCKVYGSTCENSSLQEHTSKVLQRCLSIPVTMRSLIHTWQHQKLQSNGLNNGNSLGMPPGNDPGRHGGTSEHSVPDFDVGRVKSEPDGGGLPHGQSLGSGRPGFGPELADTTLAGFQSPLQPTDSSLGISSPFQLGALLSGPGPGKGSGILNILGDQATSTTTTTSAKKRKRKGDGTWRSPKRKQNDDCEIVLESSGSDSTPLGTPTSRDTPMDGGMDCEGEKDGSDFEDEEIMELEDDVEDMLKVRKPKKEKKTSSTIILDLADNKNMVAPSVSITPITTSTSSGFNSVLTGMGLERRPGIEIIPIVSAPATSLPSSITITPISSKSLSEDRSRERKSGKSKTDDKSRLEKKRKRKREDSPSSIPMGPPDKLPLKQDPLSKPVSVSIKPTESPPMSSARPGSPASTLRKITSSPTHMNLSVTKSSSSKSSSSSSSSTAPSSSSSSSHQSPKHSPGYNTSSPKHHGTSSPKHQSSGGSGKPSMSALKSAASSPSSAGKSGSGDVTKVKSSSSSSNKEKDRKVSSSSFSGGSSGSGSSPKLKSSSVKLKQLDLSSAAAEGVSGTSGGGATPPSGNPVGSKTSSVPQARNRKGSLSAVIDKLTAQHSGPEPGELVKEGRGGGNSTGNKAPGDISKNPGEYMVKPSSDGMKITINKTRTKESSKSGVAKTSSSSSGSGSPKTHTGLKPGVNSGPASKKPHQLLQQKSTTSNASVSSSASGKTSGGGSSSNNSSSTASGNSGSNNSSSANSSKISVAKGSSPVSGILSKSGSSKSAGSPKMSGSSDVSRRENKPRPTKSSGDRDKSVFPSSKGSDARKSSPVGLRDDDTFKLQGKAEPSLLPQLVEGLIKTLDTNFQIPKLSARNNPPEGDNKKSSSDKSLGESSRTDNSVKPIDLAGKGESGVSSAKFPNAKATDESKNLKSSSMVSNVPSNLSMPSNQIVGLSSTSLKSSTPSLSLSLDAVNFDGSSQSSVAVVPALLNLTPSSEISAEASDLVSSNGRGKTDQNRIQQVSGGKDDVQNSIKLDSKGFAGSEPAPLPLTGTSQSKFPVVNLQKPPKDTEKLSGISADIMNKAVPNKLNPTPPTPQEAAEILLDFSSSSSLPAKSVTTEHSVGKLTTVPERVLAASAPSRRNTPPPLPLPPPAFPNSPSVSVHIVQSPAPSPLVTPSPHSASPCITDDELMDEALVGIGK